MRAHHPERQRRRLLGDDEPEPPVPEEAMGGAAAPKSSNPHAGNAVESAPARKLTQPPRFLAMPSTATCRWLYSMAALITGEMAPKRYPTPDIDCSHIAATKHQPSVPGEGPQPLRELPHGKWEWMTLRLRLLQKDVFFSLCWLSLCLLELGRDFTQCTWLTS